QAWRLLELCVAAFDLACAKAGLRTLSFVAVKTTLLKINSICTENNIYEETWLCTGISVLQQNSTVPAGLWKSIPLAHNVPNAHFASTFSPLLHNSVVGAQLNPVFGSVPILKSASLLLPGIFQQPSRSLTYFGFRKGKRKTVKSVVKRFLRLHCGLWLRKKAGYKKRLWKKTNARKKRLRQIMICNRTQSKLLDKMTTSCWKRRNWFVNDPYQKYHDRTNLQV
ncbi:large ribosomal subunit protein bL35m, partial [Ambystoma mexicanum]|uniref:large ribosomal subunit protein bL35m n=1 Tax=Ambystoma mexicanum TaxID=8296 RepID=UPI0037E847CB